ncbi:hypothetical protein FOA52_004009 [Chlamydomonas sp. UWO 241]|nr:hypothetical protein FOA52_004009 [Chlamydomonas sp. UWO 241]
MPQATHCFVLSIPVARDANWFLAGGGRRMDEEEATAAAAERIAAAAEDGTSLPVRLATDVVRFLYGGTGRREPADGGVVSASLLNAKPAVGGIGVESRGGGVLRVLFTVASDAVADTVVRWRHELRRCVDSTAVFDVLSDREEAQHQALWPAFLAAKVAGKRAQFHRARLVVDGERVMKISSEVARGMDYLHQLKIIHRDLKAANLLLDDSGIVKIADFGVARIMEPTGNMTAETGTYRWMAPEVIEHKPYDEKADVFSFAVVVWELLTCRIPYSDMTPLQAAVGVVQKGLRPEIPLGTPPALGMLMETCWGLDPSRRPSFRELTPRLTQMLEAQRDEDRRKAQAGPGGSKSGANGLLSKLRGKG